MMREPGGDSVRFNPTAIDDDGVGRLIDLVTFFPHLTVILRRTACLYIWPGRDCSLRRRNRYSPTKTRTMPIAA